MAIYPAEFHRVFASAQYPWPVFSLMAGAAGSLGDGPRDVDP
jgi:hypothetical protein